VKLYLTGDTGGSGHGATALGTVKHLLDKDVALNFSTHEWGWNLNGWQIGGQGRKFPDTRFREKLIRSGKVNDDYLLDRKRDMQNRPHNLEELPFSMEEAKPSDLIVRDFDGKEDVNLAIGSPRFAERQPGYAYCVTETTCNTTRCPETWLNYAEKTDELWVPCEWAKDALLRTGLPEEKIAVMPYGVEFGAPTFCGRVTKLEDDTFTFGTVARWVNLKGLDVLLKAYIDEFVPSEDDVRLFLKTTVNQQAPLGPRRVTASIQNIIQDMRVPDPPEIGFGTDPFTSQQFWDMLGAFDCFVFPTRAEAIGISLVQAMGTGLPCIATDYSAIPEYFDENVGFPLNYTEVPVQQHSPHFYFYGEEGGYCGKWANPDKEHLQQLMRKVYEMHKEKPEKLEEIGRKARERARDRFSWNKHIQTRLKRLTEAIE